MRPRILAGLAAAVLLCAQDPVRRTIPPVGLYQDFVSGGEGMKLHVLAIAESEVEASKREQRTYEADHSVADPAGFTFVANNNNGIYDIGDHAPMIARTRLVATVPLPAKLRMLRGDAQVAEATGYEISFVPAEAGSYRVEARIGEKLWIRSAPIHLEAVVGRGLSLPPQDIAPTVDVKKDIPYVEGNEADAGKHKLDLYLPKGKTGFPVLIFIHGGAWRSGDRALYVALGNRFAKEGIGVVVPSYRLWPGSPHPAQIEDAFAAVDWTLREIAKFGGDTKRIWVSGHSAGGHLAAYVGLEKRLWPSIRGVIAMSGVYDVSQIAGFREGGVDGSPMHRVAAGAPPFVITYVQNDYPTLAADARRFDAALRKAGVKSELVYVPGRNHISEMTEIWRDDDLLAKVVVRTVLGK
jgi:acetyl esterase/lipase